MNILFIGSHTDDIEHAAGGVLQRIIHRADHNIRYISFSRCTDIPRNKNILEDIERVQNYLSQRDVVVTMHDYPNRRLPEYSFEIREVLENEKTGFCPHIVFTHWRGDTHQDHKAVHDECLRVFRGSTVLEYECLRSCLNFVPNTFITLSQEEINAKIELLSLYKTQALYYNSERALRALAVVRGIAVEQNLAEGFFTSRLVSGSTGCVQLL